MIQRDPLMEEKTIVCRCSDVSLKEIRDMIEQGYTNPEEIKRLLRTGMGPCQGKNCSSMIQMEISRMTGEKMENINTFHSRPPVKSVKLGKLLLEEAGDDK